MFIDQARIQLTAGNGGSGIVSFMKDKLHPKGIPDGGDGGAGGNVVFVVDEGLNTLQKFKYRSHFKASNGSRGGSKKKSGKNGEDLLISVPPGTLIKDDEAGVIYDLKHKNQRYVVTKGGIGGRGNASFAGAKIKAPKFAQKGEPGEQIWVRLELKVLADVGIVGFPNAGKSTLISVISRAKPKIADYPFTTITPNLGVVETRDGYNYLVADIPGLIEGAHKGKGLGDAFLRHVERAGILIHVLDASADEPAKNYKALNDELRQYSAELAKKFQIIVLNKTDIAEKKKVNEVKQKLEPKGLAVFAVSALKKEGTAQLADYAGEEVQKRKVPLPEEKAETVYRMEEKGKLSDFKITKEGKVFKVRGKPLERLVLMTNAENEEALSYLHKQFKKIRLDERLKEAGAEEGDTIDIAGVQFDFTDEQIK